MSLHAPFKFDMQSGGMGREGRFSEGNNPGHCGTHSCVQVIVMVMMVVVVMVMMVMVMMVMMVLMVMMVMMMVMVVMALFSPLYILQVDAWPGIYSNSSGFEEGGQTRDCLLVILCM